MIPDRLVNKMIAAKNVNSGLNTLQQIFYGIYDFTLHDGFDPFGEFNTTDLAELLQNEITLYPYLDGTHMQASFGHLVGYEAAYYGYLWSEVFAQDMFSIFENEGILNSDVGERYRRFVLEKGGAEDPMKLLINFLGREPNSDAFYSSIGLE